MIKADFTVLTASSIQTSSAGPQKSGRDFVIPAWNAGIQIHMDVSGRPANLDAGNPCRHDGGETRAVPRGLPTLAESFVFIFDGFSQVNGRERNYPSIHRVSVNRKHCETLCLTRCALLDYLLVHYG
jgi:hypothetical protein